MARKITASLAVLFGCNTELCYTPVGQNESIPIIPLGVLRIAVEEPTPMLRIVGASGEADAIVPGEEDVGGRRHSHRRT